MKLEEYKRTIDYPLCQRTLCFLMRGDLVLLGMKKTGFGKGKYLGIGGKVIAGETLEQAIIRETREEIMVTIQEPKKVATFNFYFPHVENPPFWSQQVHVFMCNKWDGEPQETDEIVPGWWKVSEIPYDKMWADAVYWLPQVLKGQQLIAEFLFDKEQKVEDHKFIKESM